MAVYDLEEQEQLSELKAWWEQYGKLVTTLVLALALGAAGWQGWHWYQRRQSAAAAQLYSSVQKAEAEHNATAARELAGRIFEDYGRTAYADLAALLSAKAQVEAGDLQNAKAQLDWLVQHGNDPALKAVARLRLATVLIDQKAYDEALKLLDGDLPADLKVRALDLKGDLYAAQGKLDDAKKAYQSALDALGSSSAATQLMAEVIRTKMESLGV